MSLKHENIENLIALCKQKNSKAEFEIYHRYCKAMYNVALRIVNDKHHAEDTLQEGFLKAFLKIEEYKQEVAFGAWLKRIIINQSINLLKKNNKSQLGDIDSILYNVADEDINLENDFNQITIENVLFALKKLKDSYRTVLTLFFIEGYDYEEIAEILNLSNANCRTTMSRAKEQLRSKLNEIHQK